MKELFLILKLLFVSFVSYAQYEKLDTSRVKTYSVLQNGDYVLGIDEIYPIITNVGYYRQHNIYRVDGYLLNYYTDNDCVYTFEIKVYDSISALSLNQNPFEDHEEAVFPISSYIGNRRGLFSIYI